MAAWSTVRPSTGSTLLSGTATMIAEAAVDVHAEHPDALAAVRLAAPAGDAVAAGQVGNDGDRLPRPHGTAGRCLHDLAPELMAHDAGVGQERLLAAEDVEIGAADADTTDADQHFAGSGRGLRSLHQRQAARLVTEYGSHGRHLR